MNGLVKTAVEKLKGISSDISETPELPTDSPKDALELDDLLTNIMDRVDQIVNNLQKA